MAAQPLMQFSDRGTESIAESAVAVWAVVNVLDTIPGTPETQLAFEEARSRLQRQIAATGFDTAQIDLAFRAADVPWLDPPFDPPLTS